MGNICRSPTGEGLLRHEAESQGLADELEIDSAGTIGYHTGAPPDPRMTRAAARRGYVLEGSARQIEADDFDRFDLIVAMDSDNLADIHRAARRRGGGVHAEIRLLSSFLPEGSSVDVPDPYYGGEQGFETVIDMIEEACPPILEYLART